jgi:23S rRNA pseudouridine2605 synthase
VKAPETLYLALNKPPGYVTTLRNPGSEPEVVELVEAVGRVFPVGRLDKDTSGLLLLTNDGAWANLVMHPRYMIEKEYVALVKGRMSTGSVRRLEDGVELPDGARSAPARVRRLGEEGWNTRVSVTVVEGRKRQIRHMLRAVGHTVIELTRVRVGPVHLGSLPVGRWRRLRKDEVEGVRAQARGMVSPVGPGGLRPDHDRRTRRGR